MSVQPARHNFKVWKGATFRYKFTYLTGAEGSPAQNLTGYTAEMILKDPRPPYTTYLTLSTENGGIVLGDALGTIEILIDADDTEAFTWQSAKYQLKIMRNEAEDVLLYGTITATGF